MARKKNATEEYPYANIISTPFDFRDKSSCIRDISFRFLDRLNQMFTFDGLPDTISKFNLLRYLQTNGNCIIYEHEGQLYAFTGSLGGVPDEYYIPTEYVFANPYLNLSKIVTIKDNKDAVLIKHDSYMQGLMKLINKYATLLVESELSLYITTINVRNQDWISAPDTATKTAAEKYITDLENGKLSVIAENYFLEGLQVRARGGIASTYITQQLELEQYLTAQFFQEIGVQATPNKKREYISESELTHGDNTLMPLIDDICENIQNGIDRVNEKYGTNITMSFNSAWGIQEKETELDLAILESEIENPNPDTTETEKETEKETDSTEKGEQNGDD